jgi:hypothetical protein
VFQQLLQMVPRLNERLLEGSEEECMMMSDLVCSSAELLIIGSST